MCTDSRAGAATRRKAPVLMMTKNGGGGAGWGGSGGGMGEAVCGLGNGRREAVGRASVRVGRGAGVVVRARGGKNRPLVRAPGEKPPESG